VGEFSLLWYAGSLLRAFTLQTLRVKVRVAYKTLPHLPEPHDSLDVHFVFLHLLSEPDGLLHLSWVDVLGPPTLTVIHATVLHLIPDCVCLESESM